MAKRLQQVLSSAKSAGIVDADAMISIRDGHAVIPVSAANKRKLSGFIHDESATGRTFYVEPVEVVELNNALRELEYAQRREIVRILTEMTDALRNDVDGMAQAGAYLAEIDALRAQARAGRWTTVPCGRSSPTRDAWCCAVRVTRCWRRRCVRRGGRWCRSTCSSKPRNAYWSYRDPMRAASRYA